MYISNPAKATERDFLNYVLSLEIDDDARTYATSRLMKLDERNEKRKSTPSKTAVANEPIKAAIVNLLADGGKFANEVSKSLEISTQKASALLRQLVADNLAEVTEVKVKGKGACKFYTLKDDESNDGEVEA